MGSGGRVLAGLRGLTGVLLSRLRAWSRGVSVGALALLGAGIVVFAMLVGGGVAVSAGGAARGAGIRADQVVPAVLPRLPASTRVRVGMVAAAERLRSRTRFGGESGAAALSTAVSQLGVARSPWRPSLPAGSRVARYLGPTKALVTMGSGRRGVLLAGVPLVVRHDGSWVPVDLSLVRHGSRLSATDSPVRVTVNDELARGVSVGSITLVPSSDRQSVGPPRVVGGKAFFANAARDTDFMVAPLADGAEASWVLRSQASPQHQSITVGMPAGWRLKAADHGSGAVIVDRAGAVRVMVAAPTAVDAAGNRVPVLMSVEGDVLRVAVDDRGSGVLFPVLVDPRFSFGGYGAYVGPGNFSGWSFSQTGSAAFVPSDPGSGSQWVAAQANVAYAAGSAGEWIFKAPGSSYIYELDVGGMSHDAGATQANSDLLLGIYNADGSPAGGSNYADGNGPPSGPQPFIDPSPENDSTRRVCTTSYDNGDNLCPASGNPGNEAIFGLIAATAGPWAYEEWDSVGGVEMMLGDNAAPSKPTTNIPQTGSVDRLRVTSTQGGLGLSDVQVSFPTGGTGPGTSTLDYPITCENGQAPFAYCPLSETVTFGAGLPDGSYPITVTATAAGGATATSTQTLDFKADSSTPTSTTGQANQVLAPTETQGGGNPAELPCQPCHGDPVNTFSGDYFESATDIAIPGRGPGLGLTRTYSSLAAASGESSVLGHGWSINYGMGLAVDQASGNVTITSPDGSQTVFDPDGAGGYTAPSRVLATLSHNGDGSWTYTVRARTIYTFDASGRLTGVSDLDGNTTTLAYNASGQLQTATDGAGRSLTFAYNAAGEISSVTDQTGRSVSYGYDSAGNLTQVTDVRGGAWVYTYDGSHLLLTRQDPNGNVVMTNTYDSQGRTLTQTDALGEQTSYAYTGSDPSQQTLTRVTDPNGNVTEYSYAGGLLMDQTSAFGTPEAATFSYAYDPNTQGLTSFTDPDGNATTATYDTAGNRTSTTDALGHTTTATFDALNDETSSTDPSGVTTTYTYDSRGNLLSSSTPLVGSSPAQTQTTTYAYDDPSHPGDLTSVTDPDGHKTIYSYDTDGNLASSTDPAGDQTTYSYDQLGRLTSMVSPAGNAAGGQPSEHTTSYSYDPAENLLTQTDQSGHTTNYAYDADGNRISVTDPDTNTTSYSYDHDNRLTQITRADQSTLTNSYDADGNLTGQTDGAGHTTSYAYDRLGRLISITDPLKRSTSFSYDAAGNRLTTTDPQGRTTTYGYDKANRVTSISYSDGITPQISYGYDADGHRTSMSDGTGSSTYGYDSLGRLTSQTNGAGQTVSYDYDLDNNTTSITYPNARTVSRAFDPSERLTSVTDWLGNKTSFSYDADSNLQTTTFPAATSNVDSYSYNDADQLTGIQAKQGSTTVAQLTYTRDPDGMVASETQTGLPGPTSTDYGYTPLQQLASAGSQSYAYDHADNITQLDSQTGYSYDNANELTSGPAGTYGYDQLGQRTSLTQNSQTTSYAYDQAGDLIKTTPPTGSATSYTYDGDGLKATKTTGTTTSQYAYDQTAGIPLILTDGQNSYIYGPDNLPIEQIDASGTPSWLHHDQLGSTRLITNQTGAVTGAITYNPYGAVAATSGTATAPLGYAGQYTDPETGLQYDRARYYDPNTGQFLSRDPAAQLTRQPYSYANDNPLNGSDPSGLCGSLSSWGGFWANCGSDITGAAASGARTVASFVEQNYGTVVEGAGFAACLVPAVGAPVCAAVTISGLGLSAYENWTDQCKSISERIAGQLVDALAAVPGGQELLAEKFGAEGAGKVALKILATSTGAAGAAGGTALSGP